MIKKILILFFITFSTTAFTIDQELLDELDNSRIIKQQQIKQHVIDNLPLTHEQAIVFWPIYDQYRHEIKLLNNHLIKLIKNYAEHYVAKDFDNIQSTKMLEESLDIEIKRIQIKRKYIKIFKQKLPEKLVVRYFHVDNQIEALLKYGISKEIPLVPMK
jgi:hypothetical protein